MSGLGGQNVLLIPALGTPVIDLKTGKMSREWYRFFTLIGTYIGPDPTPVPPVPIVYPPPTMAADPSLATDGDLLGVSGFAAQAIGMIQDLQQQISDLQKTQLPPSVAAGLANMLANAHIFVGNGAGIAADVPVSGDISLANTGAMTIVTIAGQQIGTFTTQLIGKGTATNDDAAAGYIGEYLDDTVAFGSPTALTNGVGLSLASRVLGPGDYDVSGVITFNGAAGTLVQYAEAGISTVNNTQTASGLTSRVDYSFGAAGVALFAVNQFGGIVGPTRITVAAATTKTIYCVATLGFTVSTANACCEMRTRRVR